MALIEITVDNPSLINTGEGDASRETTDEESGLGLSSGREREDGDTDTDLIGTVGTFVTALSALAGVLRQLRSEEETGDAEDGLGLTDEDTDDSILGDSDEAVDEIEEIDETEDEALETGLEGEDADEEETSGSGLGTKVAILLVIVLVVAVLWFRGGDEETEFEEFDA